MSSSEFDVRMKLLEGRVDKAEGAPRFRGSSTAKH